MDSLRALQSAQLSWNPGRSDRHSEQQNSDQDQDEYSPTPLGGEELSEEEEQAEGLRHQQEILSEYGLWAGGQNLLEECARRLGHTMARPDLCYGFQALDTERPLASSCANGMVYFSRGLLERLSLPEVCYFGAHEIAHTELRHYATRRRRLSDLQQAIPAQAGSAVRLRVDQAAVLAVRHQEEFEADHQAAVWLDFDLAGRALARLEELCARFSPEMLTVPSHPTFAARIARIQQGQAAPDMVSYCYSLLN
ncbi:hypothetical protein JST97_30115 [bacterium]|nr:hypothetical protein [bacterium]